MKVVIRADAGRVVGSGHLMRCLALADELKNNYAKVTFVCRNIQGNMTDFIVKRGYSCEIIPNQEKYFASDHEFYAWMLTNAAYEVEQMTKVLSGIGTPNWLIIDHYGIDYYFEKAMQSLVKNVMVIDDLANRRHECDLLLDQNYYPDRVNRYDNLVPATCIKLLGPEFTILKPEFAQLRKKSSKAEKIVKNIIISFGGSDNEAMTLKTLAAILNNKIKDITFEVVIGQINPYREAIEKICKQHINLKFHYQISNMAELMSKADLFIGSGGTTNWERLCLGLPAIIISTAENQVEVCQNLADKELIHYLGTVSEFSDEKFNEAFTNCIKNYKWRNFVHVHGQQLVDGKGTSRVSGFLFDRAKNEH